MFVSLLRFVSPANVPYLTVPVSTHFLYLDGAGGVLAYHGLCKERDGWASFVCPVSCRKQFEELKGDCAQKQDYQAAAYHVKGS